MVKLKNNPSEAIYLTAHGFSLIKFDQGSYFYENHKNASFTSLLRECGIFFTPNPPQHCLIIFANDTPVLVPKDIFQKPEKQFLIEKNISDTDQIMMDDLDDYISLYIIPKNRTEQWDKIGIKPIFKHVTTCLYHYLRDNYTQIDHKILLYFSNNWAYMIFFKDAQLQIISQIECSSPENVLYYLLNIMHQHELEPMDCQVFLSGEPQMIDKIYPTCRPYLPHLDEPILVPEVNVFNKREKKINACHVLPLLYV